MLSEKRYECEVDADSKSDAERILTDELTKAMMQVNTFENVRILSVIEATATQQAELQWTERK